MCRNYATYPPRKFRWHSQKCANHESYGRELPIPAQPLRSVHFTGLSLHIARMSFLLRREVMETPYCPIQQEFL